jgi:3-oxoacyl-[acyl-carrier protein] reductase
VFAAGTDIPMAYVETIEDVDWSRTLDGELGGFYHVVRAALPLMRERGGSFVAVTSAGIHRHPPRDVLSTVPKAGVEALIRAVAREEGRHGIRANAVALGVVDAGHFHKVTGELTPEFLEAIKRNTALFVVERVPLVTSPMPENARYLSTKQTRMGHVLNLDAARAAAQAREVSG